MNRRASMTYLAVSQDAVEVASAKVKKAHPHADPFAFFSYFTAPGRDLD